MSTKQLKPGRIVAWQGTSQEYTATFTAKDEGTNNPRYYFRCPELAGDWNPQGVVSMSRYQINRDCRLIG